MRLQAAPANIPQAKEHNKVINACALRLAGHDQTNPTCAGDHKCDACYDFIEGLELLANCAAEWIYPHRSFKDMSAAVLHKLRSLSEYQQRAFNVLLTKLLGDANWAESDYDVVTDGDFEISAVVWALKLGPRGLAAGWEAGKSTLAILMDEEEAWILANIAHVKYNDKKQILEDYADAICGWALDLQRTVADGDE